MLTVVDKPVTPVLTLEAVKAHLRLDVDDTGQDGVLDALIAAVTAHLDGPDGCLNRCLRPQTLEWTQGDFTTCPAAAGRSVCIRDNYVLALPCGPVQEVVEITYEDPSGARQTLDPAAYELRADLLSAARGKSWPATAGRWGAVAIRYRAGYAAADFPAAIDAALKLMLGTLYENRECSAADAFTGAVQMLLGPFWRFV